MIKLDDIKQVLHYISEIEVHNKTICIVLCETKDLRLIQHENIYQIKYLSELPKDEELLKIINDNKIFLLKTEELKLETT